MSAPPTLASLDAAMQLVGDLVVGLTGLPSTSVMFANTDQAQPSVDHIIMQPLADEGVMHPVRVGANAQQACEVDVLLTAHGWAAVTALRALKTTIWMDTPTRITSIQAGLMLRSVSSVTDQSALDSSSVQPRAAMTVRFAYVLEVAAAEPPEATEVYVTVNGGPAIITNI